MIRTVFIAFLIFLIFGSCGSKEEDTDCIASSKTKGLIYGSMLGDALGGPIEFQSHDAIQQLPNPPKLWKDGEKLDSVQLSEASKRIILRDYRPLRPIPEPYGHWTLDSGAVTDDTRHKMVLLYALSEAKNKKMFPINSEYLADSYLKWIETPFIKEKFAIIANENFEETFKAIRWMKGNRNLDESYPPERLWSSLPTCYGSMSLLPIGAIYPGNPEAAYRMAYDLAFFDNGFGRDLNASLVAGLSMSMSIDLKETSRKDAWQKIYNAMRTTDPYGYSKVPWTYRSVDKYLDLALHLSKSAQGEPKKLFDALEVEFRDAIKWEAQVPFVVVFSCLEICNYDPLAALALTIEWGHDHDSYAQLLGAFIGALHGYEIFRPEQIVRLRTRMIDDYNQDAEDWAKLITQLASLAQKEPLVKR